MAKTKLKIDRVWVILTDTGFHSAEVTFDKAGKEAKKTCEDGSSEVKILEVVAVWNVEYPEEPAPEIFEASLDSF